MEEELKKEPVTSFVLVDDLVLLENNPRIITKNNFEKLKKSIKDNPDYFWARPILANNKTGKNVVYAGNQRLRAAIDLGMNEVPCIIETLSNKQQKERTIRDNVELGTWNMDMLTNEWDTGELQEWGLDLGWGEPEKEGNIGDDELPEEDKTPKRCNLGDIWELGNHRLMCGDSTKKEDVQKLMNGEKADTGFNDPPYGMKKEKDGVKNDNLNFDDLLSFNFEWIKLQFDFLKENGSFYCWGTDEPLMDIYSNILKPLIKTQKATFRNLITWDKGNGQGQNSEEFRMYPIADEKCLFIMCGVQGFNNNADNYFEGWEPVRDYLLKSRNEMGWDIPTMKRIAGHSDLKRDHWTSKSQFNMPTEEVYKKFQEEVRRREDENKKEYSSFKKEYDELKKEYYGTRAYFDNTHENQNNVWHFERTSIAERKGTGKHVTPKPIDLCVRAIKSSCPEGGLVIDFFGGSGSTLIACEKINRKCYMMELDEHFCDVILKRWEDFSGLQAKKINE